MSLQYGTSTAIGIGTALNSLASSTTAFAQTDAVTTTVTENITDALVRASVVVGAITPSGSTVINFYVVGSEDGTVWAGSSATSEVITATAGAVTISTLGNNLRFLGSMICHTASVTMKTQPMSVAAAFGGMLPKKWVVVVQNQTGSNLSGSGHSISYTEAYYN